MSNPLQPLTNLQHSLDAAKPALIDAMGVAALKFIDDNFAKQGFQGQTFLKWDNRKKETKRTTGKKILSGTNALRNSIKKTDGSDHTTISTDIPYAAIHNNGGVIPHPYREVILSYTGKPGKLKLAKTNTQNQQRKVTTIRRSSIYHHTTTMPQRQFIGSSSVLIAQVKQAITAQLSRSIHIT